MGEKLKLDRQDALDIITNLSNILFSDSGVKVIIDSDLSVSTDMAICDSELYIDSVKIGINEITECDTSSSIFSHCYVPDKYVICSMIGINHEYAHYIQNNFVFRKAELSDNEQIQLLQDTACVNNDDFYHDNYLITASEVQAEQYGIMKTYEHLRDLFPKLSKNQCEKLVLDVVNEKMLTPGTGYFVKRNRPFTSLSEVDKAFDDAYQHALHTKRYYDIRDINADHLDEADYAKQYLCSHPEVEYRYDFDALEQVRFIAAINIQKHPVYLERYPVLRGMDLPDVRGKPKALDWREREADILVSNIEDDTDDYERNLQL